ncbi:unnamed protein product [Scytosiphon promiscuus]
MNSLTSIVLAIAALTPQVAGTVCWKRLRLSSDDLLSTGFVCPRKVRHLPPPEAQATTAAAAVRRTTLGRTARSRPFQRWRTSTVTIMAKASAAAPGSDVDGVSAGGAAVEAEQQLSVGPKLGFVGAGMMATAMINGIVAAQMTEPDKIVVSAAHESSLDRLAITGVRTTKINAEVASESDVVVLAVKPDVVPAVLREIAPHLKEDVLIVSIAAGVPLAVLEDFVPGKRVVRVMPNTPCLVSEGAAGFSMGIHTLEQDRDMVQKLMGSVGLACEVKESLLDGVTGVSGSGPAYIFVLIEALADGGVRMGLPRAMAIKLAAQTVKGAAAMVLETGEHPAVLKDNVCSPGGLTIMAIESLEKNGFRAAAMEAVITVASRSREMSEAEAKKREEQGLGER